MQEAPGVCSLLVLQLRWVGAAFAPGHAHSTAAEALTDTTALLFSHTYTDDLYGVLSVPATASLAEIKAAYRRLVHDLHPDKHAHKHTRQVRAPVCLCVHNTASIVRGCRACHQLAPTTSTCSCTCVRMLVALQAAAMADAFLQCKLAYEVLSDPQQRRSYDEGRAAAGGQQVGCEGVE